MHFLDRDLLAKAALENGSNYLSSLLEAQNADGQTALHLACRRGSAELVETILEYREADVDVLDKDGDPPLVFALAAGSPECVRSLIKRNANVKSRLRDGFGPSVAHVCAYHGQPDCMRELLLAGADPNAVDDEGESVLHRAIAKKYTDCALVILENGGCRSMAIVNSKNLTPLHLCVATWNFAVVKRWAEVATSDEIAEAIDIPSPIGTALCMAAASKKDHEKEGRELVRILLAAGANPSAQDSQNGRTALHTAAMTNDVNLVQVILAAGVDVNIRNVHNSIPLHLALARGAKACVGLLLAAGADYNLQDDDGDNAFHIAAETAKMIRENMNWLITMLRNPDADIEVRNHSGKTVRDILEALPREWLSEDLMVALMNRGVHLSPTTFEVGDWVKFKKSVTTPTHGWQSANLQSVGFVQSVPDRDNLIVSFCSGEVHLLANEVIKVVPLDRGQHVQLKEEVKEPRAEYKDKVQGKCQESTGHIAEADEKIEGSPIFDTKEDPTTKLKVTLEVLGLGSTINSPQNHSKVENIDNSQLQPRALLPSSNPSWPCTGSSAVCKRTKGSSCYNRRGFDDLFHGQIDCTKGALEEQHGGIDMFVFDPGGVKSILHLQDGDGLIIMFN
ncbi:unnamed protein product [Sphenostylis stenocarpa]|uniref:RING-type E3 ubiquitin transferase n=1 Tax=Sphenostylis stenocarpa TaxID=92480 RepID=A0AA86VJ62_9FABA|nr:unnamed protein product [Sphenostylis stenocarpa]